MISPATRPPDSRQPAVGAAPTRRPADTRTPWCWSPSTAARDVPAAAHGRADAIAREGVQPTDQSQLSDLTSLAIPAERLAADPTASSTTTSAMPCSPLRSKQDSARDGRWWAANRSGDTCNARRDLPAIFVAGSSRDRGHGHEHQTLRWRLRCSLGSTFAACLTCRPTTTHAHRTWAIRCRRHARARVRHREQAGHHHAGGATSGGCARAGRTQRDLIGRPIRHEDVRAATSATWRWCLRRRGLRIGSM